MQKNYYIYRSTEITGNYMKIGPINTVTYQDTDLTSGTKYFYKISAEYSSDKIETIASQPVETLTLLGAVDIANSGLSYDNIEFVWNAQPSSTGYVVYRGTALTSDSKSIDKAAVVGQVSVKNLSNDAVVEFKDTNLTSNTLYYYQVTGINASGETDQKSDVVGFKTTIKNISELNLTALTFTDTIPMTATATGTLTGSLYTEAFHKISVDGNHYIQAYLTDSSGKAFPDDSYKLSLCRDTGGTVGGFTNGTDNGNNGSIDGYYHGAYKNIPRLYANAPGGPVNYGDYYIKVYREGQFFNETSQYTLTVLYLEYDHANGGFFC